MQGVFEWTQIKEELSFLDEPVNSDSLVSLAIRRDNRLREKRREKADHPRQLTSSCPSPPFVAWGMHPSSMPQSPTPVLPAVEPMQLGQAHLPPAE